MRDGGDELGLEPRRLALGGDLAHHDDAADELAGRVAHRPGVALEGAPDVGQLEVVLRGAVRIGGDRLHRGDVGRRVGETVGDRAALLQRRVLGQPEDLGREVLDDGVREQRASLEVDQADAVDAGVEQRAVDVDEALERDLVGLHRDLMGLHGDLLGLHRDLLRLELVRLQAERRVLALEARVAPVLGGLAVGRRGARAAGRGSGASVTRQAPLRPATASPTGLNGFVR